MITRAPTFPRSASCHAALSHYATSRNAVTSRTYQVLAINLGGFDLGESDKVLYLFSAEKGLQKAVAKGAKKPKSKMCGRIDPLHINELLLASGRSFEIITEARTVETFGELRVDFERLSYGLYYAEVTRAFADGLEHESSTYFDFLASSIHLQARQVADAVWLCMEFEMGLLDFLGYTPELTCCLGCRQPITDYNLARFNIELGGVVCVICFRGGRRYVREAQNSDGDQGDTPQYDGGELGRGVHITPLVWKNLVLSAESKVSRAARDLMVKGEPFNALAVEPPGKNIQQSWLAAERLLRNYAEHRAGKKFHSLDFLVAFPSAAEQTTPK